MIASSYRVTTVFDIPLKITPVWALLFCGVVAAFTQPAILSEYISFTTPFTPYTVTTPTFATLLSTIAFSITLTTLTYASIIAHELGHAYGAARHNVTTMQITLWVLGGAAALDNIPPQPRAEIEITALGPAVSFVLAGTATASAAITASLSLPTLTVLLHLIATVNLFMLVLNLAPVFPLDGGRLFRAALATLTSYTTATTVATLTAQLLAVGIIAVSVLTPSIAGILLSVFVFVASQQERVRVTALYGHTHSLANNTLSPTELTTSTFTFKTPSDPLDGTVTHPRTVITNRGGTVTPHLTPDTDYLVVPDAAADKFTTLATHYNAHLITTSELSDALAPDTPDNITTHANTPP